MTTDTLPELPTPKYTETIRGVPCITVTEHEHLMRTYAMQAIAQATQPAEVTDEQIESSALEAGFSVKSNGFIWAVDGYVGTRVDPGLRKFARAILALHHVRVPMTDEERKLAAIDWSPCVRAAFNAGVKAAERHHGIIAHDKKEAT